MDPSYLSHTFWSLPGSSSLAEPALRRVHERCLAWWLTPSRLYHTTFFSRFY